jgi:hypothetical protein
VKHKAKNIKLNNVTKDSGWLIYEKRNCFVSWVRFIQTSRSPESIEKELFDSGDYDGWTGVKYAKGLNKSDGTMAFISEWDSGD